MYKLKLYDYYWQPVYRNITESHRFVSEKQAVWWLYNKAPYLGITLIQNYYITEVNE